MATIASTLGSEELTEVDHSAKQLAKDQELYHWVCWSQYFSSTFKIML